MLFDRMVICLQIESQDHHQQKGREEDRLMEKEKVWAVAVFFYNHTNIHACTYNQDETSRSIG